MWTVTVGRNFKKIIVEGPLMEEYGDGLLNSNYEGNVYTCQNGFPSFQDIPSGWCLHDCSAD